MINIYFWGVRGSTPCSGENFTKYGGHTSCVSVEYNNKHIIFDSGTGIKNFGKEFPSIDSAILFLSHAHYDHVVGLPFFDRIWDPEFFLTINAGTLLPFGGTESFLKKYLFGHPFFPVNEFDIPCKINYVDFTPGESMSIDKDIRIETLMLDHPGGSVGYALYCGNKKICYITDTVTEEPKLKDKICEFIHQADVCIYDSTFTDAEKEEHASWKHSSWQDVVNIAQETQVKKMFLYHHSPLREDNQLDEIQIQAKEIFPNAIVAKEGIKVTI